MAPKIRMAVDNPSYQDMVNRQLGKPVFKDGGLTINYETLPEVLIVYEANKKRVGNKYVGNWEGEVRYAA